MGIHCFQMALSDQDGRQRFYRSNIGGAGSIVEPNMQETGVSNTHDGLIFRSGPSVQTSRLDTFCAQHRLGQIDHIHMDAQGAEYQIVVGLGDLRPRSIWAETCEFNTYRTGLTLGDFDRLMTERQYRLVFRDDMDSLYALEQ